MYDPEGKDADQSLLLIGFATYYAYTGMKQFVSEIPQSSKEVFQGIRERLSVISNIEKEANKLSEQTAENIEHVANDEPVDVQRNENQSNRLEQSVHEAQQHVPFQANDQLRNCKNALVAAVTGNFAHVKSDEDKRALKEFKRDVENMLSDEPKEQPHERNTQTEAEK